RTQRGRKPHGQTPEPAATAPPSPGRRSRSATMLSPPALTEQIAELISRGQNEQALRVARAYPTVLDWASGVVDFAVDVLEASQDTVQLDLIRERVLGVGITILCRRLTELMAEGIVREGRRPLH